MNFKYNKLYGRLAELRMTQDEYAQKLGISRTSLYKRLNSQAFFTQDEILKNVEILKISKDKIPEYFFEVNVMKS